MFEGFIKLFVDCMDMICLMDVVEVKYDDMICVGCIYVVLGGDKYMVIECKGIVLKVLLNKGELVCYLCLFVDVLFQFVVVVSGCWLVCVLLIGMGCDGVDGMMVIWCVGGMIIVQNKEISVVFGMLNVV